MEPVSREQIVAIIRQRADRLRDAEVRVNEGLPELMRIRDNWLRERGIERVGRNIDPAPNGHPIRPLIINGHRDLVPVVEPREIGDRGLPEFRPVGEQAIRPRVPLGPPPVAVAAGIPNPDQPQVLVHRQLDPLGGHPVMFRGDHNNAQDAVDFARRARNREIARNARNQRNHRMQEIERDHADRVGRLNALGVALEDAQRRLRDGRAQGDPQRADRGPLFRQATIPSDEDDCGPQIARTMINVSVEGEIISYASSPDQPSSVGLFIWGKCLK